MAPVRGQMARPGTGPLLPVAKRSLVDEAREQQAAQRASDGTRFDAYRRVMQATSDDPKMRERAEAILGKSEGVPA